jgi:formylglycine-generating enzyme required for sulfatase activity
MKYRICLLLMIEVLVGIHQALAQITNLGIASAGNQSVLFWPTTLPNYILQNTTNLTLPNWVTVNAVPINAVAVTNTLPVSFFRLIRNTTSDSMVFIPPGTFTMGDSMDGEADAIPTITTYVSAFYMDTNQVNFSRWQTVYNWATNNGYGFVHASAGKTANHPVQTVDWYDTVKWCNARSQLAGLTAVYYKDAGFTHVYTNGEVTPYVNWTNSGYRLPTEAEWEKAARGGLSGQRFPWGNTISESQANYFGNTISYSYDLDRTASTQLEASGEPHPLQVRWDHLRRMAMDSTTWLGIYLSGVGTGMERLMQEAAIHTDWQREVSAFCAAAVRVTTPTKRGAPFVTTLALAHRISLFALASGE